MGVGAAKAFTAPLASCDGVPDLLIDVFVSEFF
jgi:hypothetical protein